MWGREPVWGDCNRPRPKPPCNSIDEMASSIADATLDEDSFVQLLGSLINEAKFLQNNPPELVPVEDRGKYCTSSLHPWHAMLWVPATGNPRIDR